MAAVRVLIVSLMLAGCGGERADDEGEIRAAFESYNRALATRDWAQACEQLAPESREEVRTSPLSEPAKDCVSGWEQLSADAGEELTRSMTTDERVTAARIDRIEVTGDSAAIDWHWVDADDGERHAVTQAARRVDGEWKLVDDLENR